MANPGQDVPIRPRLDHVVVDIHDRMDEAVAVYRRLGFHMTPRGRHSLGSINHLAIFADDYLELLGFDQGGGGARPELARYPIGLNGLVFGMDDPEAVHATLAGRGVPVQQPLAFTRPVLFEDGSQRNASFRTVRLGAEAIPGVRTYFCNHLTPDLVWRDAWRAHPNGALAIDRVVMVADEGAAHSTLARMFGADAIIARPDGEALPMRAGRLNLVSPATFHRLYPGLGPDPAGRASYLGALRIVTSNLDQCREILSSVPEVRDRLDGIAVPAAAAFNVVLDFVDKSDA